ncbi:MAG: leucine-rich repeat domain-containing protein, partial [Anaeroplasmataceae bacterium]|nr:leucine-rich repeat domain-containing protein [Anaeroplasmataceae bacterium]
NIKEIHIPALNDEFGMLFGTESYENSVPVVQRQGTYYLPSNLNTVKVACPRIPTFSFLNCNSITKLILENVEEVEGFAFQDCFGITELYLTNCQSFAEGVFRGCNSLNKVHCNSLEDWLNLSFVDYLSTPMAYASELYVQNILIKEFDLSGQETIGDYQFYGLSQMEELHLPDVKTIGNQAFMGCNSLNTLWLSQSLESCYSEAFAAVGSLESIYYDGTLEDWSKIVFHDQYATPMLYSPAFYGKIDEDYQLISEITLSSEISSIGDYQFYGFTNITDLSFQNVSTIGNKAFASMGNVENFYMPNTIEQIEEDAFADTSLLNVHYAGTLEEWANIQFLNSNSTPLCSDMSTIFFDNAIDLESIELSSSIETIGNYQFYGFKTTKSFESSTPLISIGQNAFANCVALESFSFDSTEDTILMENAFLGCTNLKNVYYKGTLDAYMKLTYK